LTAKVDPDKTKTPMTEPPKSDTRNGFHGKPGRSSPKPGSPATMNGLRHGMRDGKLPKGCAYIEYRLNSLRRQVEAAVVETKGEIGIVDAAAINSILKWERHGLLAAHWLRKEAEKLSPSDRLRFSEAIARASDNRDKNIRALGLDRDVVRDAWSQIDALPAPEGSET